MTKNAFIELFELLLQTLLVPVEIYSNHSDYRRVIILGILLIGVLLW